MTWLQFKKHVRNKVRQESSSYVTLDNINNFDGEESEELWRLFQTFCRLSRQFWVPAVAITPENGDQEIDLMDGTDCSRRIFKVGRVWLGGNRILAYDMDALQAKWPQNDVDSGLPDGWAENGQGKLYFNCPVDATTAALTNKISGFADHPDLVDNSSLLKIDVDAEEAAAEAVASWLGRPVGSEDLALARLAEYSRFAAEYVRKSRGRGEMRADMEPRITR